MLTTIKTCFKCKAEKAITEFYVHPAMGDGRLNKCKECTKKDVSENYRANSEHYRKYERERFKTADRKAAVRRYQAERRERHPEKNKARYALTNAVRDGRIDKPEKCSKCGTGGRVEGHHHDYSKPLDVRWLCFKHHREYHGQQVTERHSEAMA